MTNADDRLYQCLAADLRTNEVIDLVPFTSFAFTESKNRVNGFKATAPLTTNPHPSLANKITRETLLPGARRIIVLRNGEPVANNILWNPNVSAIPANTLSFSGGGNLGYLGQRRIRTPLSFTGDQFLAVDEILNHCQYSEAASVGLVASYLGVSGVTRTIEPVVAERRSYLEVINEFANAEDGFDYLEQPTGTEATGFGVELRLATSLNVVRPNVSIEVGRNAKMLSYSEDAQGVVNVFDAISQPTTGAVATIKSASSAASLTQYQQMDGFARVETEPGGDTSLLEQTAIQRVGRFATPVRSISVSVETGLGAGSGISADFSTTHVGAIFRVAADYGWLEFDEDFIVEERSVSVNENGEEEISLRMTNRWENG